VYTKKIIQLISDVNTRDSCGPIFMDYRIFTVTLLYILVVLCCIRKKTKGNLEHNFHIRGYNTGNKIDLHTKSCNTTSFQKSVLSMGVRLG